MPRRLRPLVCALLLSLAPTSASFAQSSSPAHERPSIGLVLSGGGARGAAHIGVLRVLEEHRVPVDYITGTSMGAIVGGLYVAGYSVDELEDMILQIDWADMFDDRPARRKRTFRRKRDDDLFLVKERPGFSGGKLKFPRGVLDGQKADLLFKRYTLPVVTIRDFDELRIPYRAVAANLETGEAVVLGSGDLARAIRSSMSLPVVFAPREINGILLVDGGISSNTPIEVVRQMGADMVIAVDIGTPMKERDEIHSVLDVTDQLTCMLTGRNTAAEIATLTEKDILIRPELGDIATGSFTRALDAVPKGAIAAEAISDRLDLLSVSEDEYNRQRGRFSRNTEPPVIDRVEVVNNSRLSDKVILEHLDIPVGKPLDVDRIEDSIGQVYGLGLFELVYYDISEQSGENVLTVTANETSWGPIYLQFGTIIYEDYEGPNFNLAVAYTRTAVNGLNAEWRTGTQIGQEPGVYTEFFQPLDYGLRKYAQLRLYGGEEAWNVFNSDGKKTTELGLRRYGAELALGRELGRWGDIRAGMLREASTVKVQVGDPETPESDFEIGEAYIQFFIDEINDVRFPTAGEALRLRLTRGMVELGSEQDYEQGTAEGVVARTAGRNTALLAASYRTTRRDDAPIQRTWRLGGFTRLSGLEQYEINGQHSALVSGLLYRKIVDSPVVPVFAGLSVEFGNVFSRRDEIKWDNGIAAGSIFLGLDTPIGPVYTVGGFAEGGRRNFYLILGQSLGLHFTGLR